MNKYYKLLFTLSSLLLLQIVHGQSMTYEEFTSQEIVFEKTNSQWAQQQDYVVLISIDGFRYDYAEKYGATNIQSFLEKGAASKRMIPSFPSKTFPNHYTLVTGMRPGNSGLVGNSFYSRSKDAWYEVRDKSAVRDSSWYNGVPLWSLAEQNGMLSASLFWVGSEAAIAGERPTYYYTYNGKVPNEYRLRKVAEWLQLPAERRPHMMFAYFSLVDDAGHKYGPDHEMTRKAVLEVDEHIGNFLEELKQIDLNVHVVLVSDHGMSTINRGIVLPDAVDLDDAQVSFSLPPMIYQPDSQKLDKLYNQLIQIPNVDVYKKEQIPDYLALQNNDRVGDLILITSPPTVILDAPKRVYGGTHGFDPYRDINMGAIFYALGPQIKSGIMMPPIENIHVYPLIAKILGLTYDQEIDGKLSALESILK